MSASASSLKRPRPDSLQNVGKDAFKFPDTAQAVGPETERFLSQSFLEQFDETTIQDSFGTSGMQTLKSTPYAQMQTPPPTRDTASRRKAQQSQQSAQETPSTIASRRMSVAGEAWRQKAGGNTPMEASPYQFTPLQITPPVHAEIYNMGPTTAPVYSQSGMLWDLQNIPQGASQVPYSISDEDPFVASSFGRGPPMGQPTQQRIPKPPPAPARLTIPQHQVLDPGRPHSAGPVSLRQTAMLPPSSFSVVPSVDPSMLWMTKKVGGLSRTRSNTVGGTQIMEDRQPYQYHLDQLKREKNLDKSRKVVPQSQQVPTLPSSQLRNPVPASTTFEPPRIGLRRSMTDSKIRTIPEPLTRPASICSVDGQDLAEGLMLGNIRRTSSPLKRYKADAYMPSFAQNTKRQSVMLLVDEKGRARAQVTTAGGTLVEPSIHEDEDDRSDADEDASLTMKSSVTAASKAHASAPRGCNDAQDALRQVVQERQRKKQEHGAQQIAQNQPLTRSRSEDAGQLLNVDQRKNTALFASNISLPSSFPANPMNVDHLENISPNNISPSTVSEQELYTPTGFQGLGSTCICNVPGDNGQPMIRWYSWPSCDKAPSANFYSEICFKWLHMTCAGIHPNHPPHLLPPYVCMSCSMFNAGGHIQVYPDMI